MKRALIPFLLLLLGACANMPDVTSYLTPYRIDVRQGNYVTQDMVAQLRPGLSKDQVRFILGTPLVADMFHVDRWDYVYRFRPGRDPQNVQQRRLIVFFEEGKLSRLGGDVVADDPGSKTELPIKPPSRVIEIAPAGEAAPSTVPAPTSSAGAGTPK